MNLTTFSLRRRTVTWVLLVLLALLGVQTYFQITKKETPEFTIRTALITTLFPGASPERVEELITDPLEKKIQEISTLDYVNSESSAGQSTIYVNIKQSEDELRPIWDELRRKVEAARSSLPAGVIGPFVNDDFGDVFGLLYCLTGEAYNPVELKEYADLVRDELLRLPYVAKVEIYGAQPERVYLEFDPARLARYHLTAGQLSQILASYNILLPGGRVDLGLEQILVEPTGNLESLQDLRELSFSLPGGESVIQLSDVAQVSRRTVDPRSNGLHYNGEVALGLGISMSAGGNIIELGEVVQQRLDELKSSLPLGLELDPVYQESNVVRGVVDNFVINLLQSIAIVFGVMLLWLGKRTGLIVGTLIPMTVVLTFAAMPVFGITINMVSLAALMIALGILVDNSIVMSESIMVLMEQGVPVEEAAVKASRQLSFPLLTSSLSIISAFLPISLAESNVGEFCLDLFRVIALALICSWLLSQTMIPLLCVRFLKPAKQGKAGGLQGLTRWYGDTLRLLLHHRVTTIAVILALFFGGIWLGRYVPKTFFPHDENAFFHASLDLPKGSPYLRTAALTTELERFLIDSLLVNEEREEGVNHFASFIGGGLPRYKLTADATPPSEEQLKMLFDASSYEAAEEAIRRITEFIDRNFADVDRVVESLPMGVPVHTPIEIRISGPDAEELFALSAEVQALLAQTPGAEQISDDWGRRVKKLVVDVDAYRAQRAGITHQDVALSLQTALSGLTLSEYREGEDRLPIILRSEEAEGLNVGHLETLPISSQARGISVPLRQVADLETRWDYSRIPRRDRLKTLTVGSQLAPGLTASEYLAQLAPLLEERAQNWPLGYRYEFGGEQESSGEAQQSIFDKLPIALMLIVFLLVLQFNNLRGPAIILLTLPLSMIGVNIGLFLLGGDMGFLAMLGVISLFGILINNGNVLLDRIRIEIEENGLEPFEAILSAGRQRLRPIILTTATTVGGLIPLYLGGGPLWESMAITIMFGLLFATVLTLIFVPILYSLFYRVPTPTGTQSGS